MNKSGKINGKDLINIGVYTAIYFVIIFAVAMLGMVPVLYPMLVVFAPIIGGIPFMLFLTKVKKFGLIWIMGILLGLLMLLTGMSWYALAVSVFTGLAAELIYKAGGYKSAKHGVISYAVFSLWVWANMLMLFLNRETFNASRAESIGQDYVDALNAITPDWLLPVLFVVCFLCGIIGGMLGKKMLKKHFEKAGIA